MNITDGSVSTFAGICAQSGNDMGSMTSAKFSSPIGLMSDLDGNMKVVDYSNSCLKTISFATGQVSAFAGQCGTAGAACGALTSATFRNSFDFTKILK